MKYDVYLDGEFLARGVTMEEASRLGLLQMGVILMIP